MTLSCFDYWRRQALDRRQHASSVGFAPVRLADAPQPPAPGVIEVALAGGERVVIHEGVSGDLVRHVLAALRGLC